MSHSHSANCISHTAAGLCWPHDSPASNHLSKFQYLWDLFQHFYWDQGLPKSFPRISLRHSEGSEPWLMAEKKILYTKLLVSLFSHLLSEGLAWSDSSLQGTNCVWISWSFANKAPMSVNTWCESKKTSSRRLFCCHLTRTPNILASGEYLHNSPPQFNSTSSIHQIIPNE